MTSHELSPKMCVPPAKLCPQLVCPHRELFTVCRLRRKVLCGATCAKVRQLLHGLQVSPIRPSSQFAC